MVSHACSLAPRSHGAGEGWAGSGRQQTRSSSREGPQRRSTRAASWRIGSLIARLRRRFFRRAKPTDQHTQLHGAGSGRSTWIEFPRLDLAPQRSLEREEGSHAVVGDRLVEVFGGAPKRYCARDQKRRRPVARISGSEALSQRAPMGWSTSSAPSAPSTLSTSSTSSEGGASLAVTRKPPAVDQIESELGAASFEMANAAGVWFLAVEDLGAGSARKSDACEADR